MLPAQELMVLNTIINNIPAMVFYKNLDGDYIAANEMFCHQLKTNPKNIIGKTDFDFYPPERAKNYYENDQKVINSKTAIEGFEEEINIDGQIKIFSTTKVLLKDQEGKPYGIIGLAYDVTESRHTEHDLLESRTRYKYMYDMFRMMADNMPDLLWAKDLRKRYLFVNKAICEKILNAKDVDEPIGKTDLFFAERELNAHPDNPDWKSFAETFNDSDDLTMQEKAPGRFEEFANAKGQFIYLDVQKSPILDEDGNMIGTVGSGRDITKQKLMEQEFQALNQRNRAIIEALPDLMFLFDDQGYFLECYVSNLKDLLAQPDEIIGKNVSDFFNPLVSLKTREMINRCLQTQTIQTFEYEIIIKDVILYYEARLIKVDENKVLSISRNITERKNLQLELIEAKDHAEESSRLKSTLLNNMSHELRTPLNGILGFSEIMEHELKDPEYIEMASHINNSGKRLMRTLDSIMQLSQLESGVKALHYVKFDAAKHLQTLLETYIQQARHKGLFMEVRNISAGIGYLDLFFFTQAISNILDNALKFTKEGGVTFEVQEIMRQNVRWLEFHIEDTGIGISETHLKLIFEEFRQASEGQNRSFEGTGLGLTVAKKMILLLGGEIEVQSKIGKGSSFTIFIPFPEHKETVVLPSSERQGDSSKKKPFELSAIEQRNILLVEDNEVNSQLTTAYLKNKYNVDWALDGPIAIEKLHYKTYDAILMDINLGPGGMDGLQAAQLIRKIKGCENIPIIALTGYTMFGDRERLVAGGCSDYLPKPFTKADILGLLEKILAQ
ncbi:MAG: PAS domain-containing protein [Bacteroidales bacterium]|nr:PAS domain-containing protein [Bacteroidales bacterium]MDD4604228.1 PAS domain-containing protein [Bacteroidales bacterium]